MERRNFRSAIKHVHLVLGALVLAPMPVPSDAMAQAPGDRPPRLTLCPTSWSVGGSALWRDKDDESKWSIEGTAVVDWLARVRWYHDWTNHFFTLVEGDLEQDEVELGDEDEDYRLLQGIIGIGVRQAWTPRTWIRASGAWTEAHVNLLRLDAGRRIHAPSFLLESQVGLADRITVTQWTWWILWRSFSPGLDSEIELIFRIIGGLDLGLRHVWRDNAATLTTRHENEIKLFTRFTF